MMLRKASKRSSKSGSPISRDGEVAPRSLEKTVKPKQQPTSEKPVPDRPNLVFVLADQMRAKDMGCSGNPQVKTPNLDRMAESGVRFVNGTTNMPVCTPARASLLTGRYAQSTGVFLNDIQMSIDEITIAHVLRDEGYDTGYVGKWHLDGPGRYTFTPPGPRRFGFDFWIRKGDPERRE